MSIQEKKEYYSLEKLIEILDDGARKLFDVPETEFDISPMEARTLLPENVDKKVKFFKACEKEALFLRKQANDMLAAARSIEGLQKKMENRLASKMVEHHFERLPGAQWNIERSSTEVIEVDDVEITADVLMEYPEYIKITYELMPIELKKAILKNKKKFIFARMKPKHTIKSVRKKGEIE